MADFSRATSLYFSRRYLRFEIKEPTNRPLDKANGDQIAVSIRAYKTGQEIKRFATNNFSFNTNNKIYTLEYYSLWKLVSEDQVKTNSQKRVYVAKLSRGQNLDSLSVNNSKWSEVRSESGISPTVRDFPSTSKPVVTCFAANCFKVKQKWIDVLSDAPKHLIHVGIKITTVKDKNTKGFFVIKNASANEYARHYEMYKNIKKLSNGLQCRVYITYLSDDDERDQSWKTSPMLPWVEIFSESNIPPTIKNVPASCQISTFSKTFFNGSYADSRLDSTDLNTLKHFRVKIMNYSETQSYCDFELVNGTDDTVLSTSKKMFEYYKLYSKYSNQWEYDKQYSVYVTFSDDTNNSVDSKSLWTEAFSASGKKPTLKESSPKNIKIKSFGPSFLRIDFTDTREKSQYDNIKLRILDGRTSGKLVVPVVTISKNQIGETGGIRGYIPIADIDKLKIGTKYYLQIAYGKDGVSADNLEWQGTGSENKFHSTAPKLSRVYGLTQHQIGILLGDEDYRSSGDFYNYFIKLSLAGKDDIYLYSKPGYDYGTADNPLVYNPIEIFKNKRLFYGPVDQNIGIEEGQEYKVSVAYAYKNQLTGENGQFNANSIPLNKITALEYSTPISSKETVADVIPNKAKINNIINCTQGRLTIKFSNLPETGFSHLGVRILTADGQYVVTRFTVHSNITTNFETSIGQFDYWDKTELSKMTSGMQYKFQITYCTSGETYKDLVQDREDLGLNSWSYSVAALCLTPEIVYAPVLDTRIPAMSGYKLTIPFKHNPAVSADEVYRFRVLIKTVSDSKTVLSFFTDASKTKNIIQNQCIEYTNSTELEKLNLNQVYKIQIAYVANGQLSETFRYSNVAMCNRIATPSLSIGSGRHNKLSTITSQIDLTSRIFTGAYDTGTPNEVVFEYKFTLSEGTRVIETTGWQLHNSLTDDLYVNNNKYRKTCFDYFEMGYELQPAVSYNLKYEIRTVNNYLASKQLSIQPSQADLVSTYVERYTIKIGQTPEAYENGYLDIQLGYRYDQEINGQIQWIDIASQTTYEKQSPSLRKGTFILRRSDSDSNFKVWNNMVTFELTENSNWDQDLHWIDGTIEHGKKYKYVLSRINPTTKAQMSWVTSNEYTPFFEHMFLSDGRKQLCLKFNPQVSSLKRTTQEAKFDTIGGKYPFFFRNGDVYYTEIPISGLISYLTDDQDLYMDLYRKSNAYLPTINLIDQNIVAERIFKLSVLDWLNNGKPKYFRSPAEGNYLVRTLNTSMSPTTELGRMLHTVSCTGYEVADNNITNLIEHNTLFIKKKKDGRANL